MKKLIDWINKVFTHPRDKVKDFGIRAILHIPVGFLMGISPIPNDKFVDLFVSYQKFEERSTHDQSWKDLNGSLIGYSIGRICLYATLVWLIIYLLRRLL